MATATDKAKQVLRKRGGTLRTGEAIETGIHPQTIYALRDSGELEVLARGVYRPAAADQDWWIPEGTQIILSGGRYVR